MANQELCIDFEFNPEGQTPHVIGKWARNFGILAPFWIKREYLNIALKDPYFKSQDFFNNLWQEKPTLPNKPGSCCILLEAKQYLVGLKEAFILPLQWSSENTLTKHDDHLPNKLLEVADLAKKVAVEIKVKENLHAESDLNLNQYYLVPTEINIFPKLPDLFSWESGFLPLLVSLLAVNNDEIKVNPAVWSTGAFDAKSDSLDKITGLEKKIKAAEEFKIEKFFYPAGSDLPMAKGFEIVLQELATNKHVFETIKPLLDEYFYPPSIDEENYKIKAYFNQLQLKSNIDKYYSGVILPKTINILKEREQGKLIKVKGNLRLIAFYDGKINLLKILCEILIGVYEGKEIVLFMTKDNKKDVSSLIAELDVKNIILHPFVVNDERYDHLVRDITVCLSSLSKDKLNIIDITTGTKLMAYALVHALPSKVDQIFFLKSKYNKGNLEPFSQEIILIPKEISAEV